MNKKSKNIEQLYSESFNNFRVEPSSGLWKSISTKLAWRNFFTFTPTTVNAWYVAGLLTIATAGALWITKPLSDNNQVINEITINNERQKAEDGRQKEEGRGQKEEGRGQKQDSSIKNTTTQHPALPSEVSTKVDTKQSSSSGTVTTKAENQESISSIKRVSPSTQHLVPSPHEPVTPKPVTPIVTHKKTNLNISQLATPHPKPKTHPALSSEVLTKEDTQHQATSNQSPDPWLNTLDSLFTNNSIAPEYKIQFPNAFTPNTNGPTNGYYTPGLPNNDVFHPVYKGVVEYHLSIFNRRGELIFESNEINTGWDGYLNDRLATQGVYVWKALGKYSNGQNFIKAGNVMLIIK